MIVAYPCNNVYRNNLLAFLYKPFWSYNIPASAHRGALGERVGDASRQPQHHMIPLAQVSHLLFLDANVAELRQVQHDWKRAKAMRLMDQWRPLFVSAAEGFSGFTDSSRGLSSTASAPERTSWRSWALSASWLCRTRPPPTPPCSAGPQTGSLRHRRASTGCCLEEGTQRRRWHRAVVRFKQIRDRWVQLPYLSCSMQLPTLRRLYLRGKRFGTQKVYVSQVDR